MQKVTDQLTIFLCKITQNINNLTELHIYNLSQKQFYFTVLHMLNSTQIKQKNTYKYTFTPHIYTYQQKIKTFINKFTVKKLFININTLEINNSILFQNKFISSICFKSIKIYQKVANNSKCEQIKKQIKNDENITNIIQKILSFDLLTQTFSIHLNISYNELQNITETIRILQSKNKYKVICHFALDEINYQQIYYFIANWCTIKCDQLQKIQNQQSQIEIKDNKLFQKIMHFKYLDKQLKKGPSRSTENSLKMIQDQVIHLQINQIQILSLNSISFHGFFIFIRQTIKQQNLLIKIVNLVLKSKYFISLQIQKLHKNIPKILQIIFTYHSFCSNYLIKLDNNIEITSSRLLLNTNGLQIQQIQQIFNLMKQPGHYEFICYGSLKYLQYAKKLFLYKPFIKFNYFVPFQQKSNKILQITNKMQTIAEQFKQKVIQFCGLFTNFTIYHFKLIEQIFMILHLTSYQ